MATMFEKDQVGKYESWEEVVANIEAELNPFTSMVAKGTKPADVIHNWLSEVYGDVDQKGVPDGKDADKFNSQARKRLQGVIQKIWHNVSVSDIAGEVKLHGVGSELARQIATAMKMLKRKMEMRCCSDLDCNDQDNGTDGYETRGAGSWLSPSEQSNLPVPSDLRPSTDVAKVDVALDTITEAAFRTMISANFKVTNGSNHYTGFVGIDLKDVFDTWTAYQDTVTGKTAVRSLNASPQTKQLIQVIDRLQFSGGTVDLHPTNWLFHDINGAATDYTHRSGLFLQMAMWKLHYTRKPRVKPLENKGGGEKRIVDAIFMLSCLNPLGQMMIKSNSAT